MDQPFRILVVVQPNLGLPQGFEKNGKLIAPAADGVIG
jgi:hypothetical protein